MSKTILISIDKLKNNSYIDKNVEDKAIRIAVEFIQDTIIATALGQELYNKISELVQLGAVTGVYKSLLEEYIHPIFYYGVASEILLPISFKQRNIGTFQASDDKVYNTGLNDIKYIISNYNNKRDYYINRLEEHLKCNKCFEEYRKPCNNRTNNYNIPINIKIK